MQDAKDEEVFAAAGLVWRPRALLVLGLGSAVLSLLYFLLTMLAFGSLLFV